MHSKKHVSDVSGPQACLLEVSLNTCNIMESDGSYDPARQLLKHWKVLWNRGDVCKGHFQIFVSSCAVNSIFADCIGAGHQENIAALRRVASPA